jgi:hypothetical protein
MKTCIKEDLLRNWMLPVGLGKTNREQRYIFLTSAMNLYVQYKQKFLDLLNRYLYSMKNMHHRDRCLGS